MSDEVVIKEKLLKDSHTRTSQYDRLVDKVVIDTRRDTHDIMLVFVRGMPVGQLVVNKDESLTLSRRLIPDTLKHDKEPGEATTAMETLAQAYFELLTEARYAVSSGNVSSLAAFFVKMDNDNRNRTGVHTRVRSLVSGGALRLSPEAAAAASSLQPTGDGR